MFKCPLYNSISDKFASIFEDVVSASLKTLKVGKH